MAGLHCFQLDTFKLIFFSILRDFFSIWHLTLSSFTIIATSELIRQLPVLRMKLTDTTTPLHLLKLWTDLGLKEIITCMISVAWRNKASVLNMSKQYSRVTSLLRKPSFDSSRNLSSSTNVAHFLRKQRTPGGKGMRGSHQQTFVGIAWRTKRVSG